jgi:type IV pilus assembly protein PilC
VEFFQYKAIDTAGRVHNGKVDAVNVADLEMRLKKLGLDLINYKELKAESQAVSGRGVKRRDLIMLCFHLEQTSKAGVPILDSLEDLRDSTENPRLREIISAMSESIEGGRTLSQTMRDFPGVFDNVFASLVHAGEQTGELAAVFTKLGESLKWQDELASQTKKVLMYPAIVGTVVTGVVFFLMIYLVPQLLSFVKTMGQQLPAHTLALIAVSNFFVAYWYLVLLLPVLALVATGFAVKSSPAFRLKFDGFLLKLPVLGPILKKLILARVAGFFAMMYGAGITIIDCIRTAEDIADNSAVRRAMADVGQQVADGNSLSKSFQATGLFPRLVIRMIIVGETTGALQASLENIAYFYTRDVRESIDKLQSVIQPAMTVVLGAIIGWVMFSVLGPIYDLITNIKI